jgi:hypothetical protein
MKAVIESEWFARELGGWGLRGVLCAAVSFGWALVAGFTAPVEIAGMVAGVAAWVAIFAVVCAWPAQSRITCPAKWVPALKVAAWIKFAFSAAGGAVFWASSLGVQNTILDAGIVGVMPDALMGMLALGLVGVVSGHGGDQLPKLDSFGWTALATFVDGILFALVIGVLALAVLAWWRFGPGLLAKLKLSPTRCAG